MGNRFMKVSYIFSNPPGTVSYLHYNHDMSENTYFEKQRDLLIQEIGLSMESVIYQLDTLNRSLSGSISVGKEFDEVARLWSHFYDGANQLRERKLRKEGLAADYEAESPSDGDGEADGDDDGEDDNDALYKDASAHQDSGSEEA